MIKAGVKPNEVTLTTLLKKIASFEKGRELAQEARESQNNWHTGRSFYGTLFAKEISHLNAKNLLEVYQSLPLKFEVALQSPIKQYQKARCFGDALEICLYSPHLQAAQKFYRQNYEFCKSYLKAMSDKIENKANFHY